MAQDGPSTLQAGVGEMPVGMPGEWLMAKVPVAWAEIGG